MTLLKFLIVSAMILGTQGAYASPETWRRETTCNVRYNSAEVLVGGVKCEAWFDSVPSLTRVKFYYPSTKTWYDWSVASSQIAKDSRWNECIRYTTKEGNQWQICTVPSPKELGLK